MNSDLDPRDHAERDELLFGEVINWDREQNDAVRGGTLKFGGGSVREYDAIDADTLATLVEEDHADPTEQQNFAPNIGEFLAFAAALGELDRDRVPEDFESSVEHFTDRFGGVLRDPMVDIKFIGYAVSPNRGDYRVSIEGYTLEGIPTNDALVVAEEHGGADSFDREETGNDRHTIYTWWD